MSDLRPSIRPLPDALINQIAAGEVVERPVSIVKELIENSLDAGAGAIRVEIEEGGIERISVSDDGYGIAGPELPLAVRRHCTSKISRESDLDKITSLGFRGEALASIGAVAELEITSRARGAAHAWTQLIAPSREPSELRPAARAEGTTITVRGLFSTLPARRNFLRRTRTETVYIQQVLRGFAFCTPGVALALKVEQRQWMATAAHDAQTDRQRRRAVFGADFATHARYIDIAADGIRVYGWVGPPRLARTTTDLQLLAVNGRLIRDRQLAHAIRVAFADQLPAGRFATYALHIETAPTEVDVNVHPSKTEVRFHRIRAVHDLIYSATRAALSESPNRVETPNYRPAVQARPHYQVAEPPALAPPPSPTVALTPARAVQIVGVTGRRFLVHRATANGVAVFDLVGWTAALLRANSELRPLLFPIRFLTEGGESYAAMLARYRELGFEFAAIGPDSWVLRGTPAVLPELQGEQFVAALLAEPMFRTRPLDAAAHAAATTYALPPLGAELNAWCARLAAISTHHGLDVAQFSRILDSPLFERIFAERRA